jgi:hypothetical protein
MLHTPTNTNTNNKPRNQQQAQLLLLAAHSCSTVQPSQGQIAKAIQQQHGRQKGSRTARLIAL